MLLVRQQNLITGKIETSAFHNRIENMKNSTSLAGMSLHELRQNFHDELFNRLLPFWDKYGIDHDRGGILCCLDYDGTPANTDKYLWFQGRALWVYSYLYNHFGQNPRHLEIARKTKEFVFQHALQSDGWYAEVLSKDGKVLKPFSGDTAGMDFVAEGLHEYSVAAGDEQARKTASQLFVKLFQHLESPDFHYSGADFNYLRNAGQAIRPMGMWMGMIWIATQMLRRREDPEIRAIANRAIDMIMNHHYNPEIGLNTEMLFVDLSRPKEDAKKSRIGHVVEVLWMVMEEADRRGDNALWETCAERIHRHLDVGWDYVYGGVAQWVNVDEPCYQWPVEDPIGTGLAMHFIGEYEYFKPLWVLEETLVATLRVYERTKAEWAARYFAMALKVIEEKFSAEKRGHPGFMLFADRKMSWQPHVARQDNYHPLRRLMLCLQMLDDMIRRETEMATKA